MFFKGGNWGQVLFLRYLPNTFFTALLTIDNVKIISDHVH